MDSVMQAIAAMLAALSIAVGVSANTGTLPDRPPIIAPVSAVPSAPALEVKGTVSSVQAGKIVVNGVTIILDKNTLVKGTLTPGANVEVKMTKQSDGTLVASKVQVTGADDSNKKNDDSVNKKDDSKKDDKSKSGDDKSGDDKSKSGDDKSGDDKSDDDKSGK